MNSAARSAGVCLARVRGRKLVARTAVRCVAFDRRRYTLPTLKRGVEEASMRKRQALILLSCVLWGAATA